MEPNTTLRGSVPMPTAPFPLLALRSGVLFPGTVMTFSVGRRRSRALLLTLHEGDVLAVGSQRDPTQEEPGRHDLHDMATFARVARITHDNDGTHYVMVEGLDRVRLDEVVQGDSYLQATGDLVSETGRDAEEARLLAHRLRDQVVQAVRESGGALESLPFPSDDPGLFADRVAGHLVSDTAKAMEVLSALDVPERLTKVIGLVHEAKILADLKVKVDQEVREELGKHQREAILREQLKALRLELGDDDGEKADDLRRRLTEAELPDEARATVERELTRLDSTGGQGPESGVIRNYLELIASLPWSKRAEVHDDLERVAAKLEADHYGLEDAKKRILEHMAVHKLSGNPRGTILCFVGPPGVGKTSLGQSIADATGRPFARIALGGIRDEAEIRGHRRTYVGALPGRILSALRKVGVKNPVLLLDEVDKLGLGWQGSPEAALLEVLDPEQNKSFTDHYLELPFDLSEVMFVCTANSLEGTSAPLVDRMEVVELGGYTESEKVGIARRHLIPKRLTDNGIPGGAIRITDAALRALISDYTREAGVRQLDRQITRLGRAVALEIARAQSDAPVRRELDVDDLKAVLGRPPHLSSGAERVSLLGVATGLAWTPVGGDILFVESSRMPGKGRIQITGKLGDVMRESASAALTYLRSHSAELGVSFPDHDSTDLHIHVPAGAVPKDGPSAGVTIFAALASLLSGRRVRADTAMTGEVTLRGRVLPVGGIKAKVLAAHRAGIRRVILPRPNVGDLDEIPADARDEMEFVLVDDMVEVLSAALEPAVGIEVAPLPANGALAGAPGDSASVVAE